MPASTAPESVAVCEAGLKPVGERVKSVTQEKFSYKVRDRDVTGDNYTTSLSGSQIPKIAVPRAVPNRRKWRRYHFPTRAP